MSCKDLKERKEEEKYRKGEREREGKGKGERNRVTGGDSHSAARCTTHRTRRVRVTGCFFSLCIFCMQRSTPLRIVDISRRTSERAMIFYEQLIVIRRSRHGASRGLSHFAVRQKFDMPPLSNHDSRRNNQN